MGVICAGPSHTPRTGRPFACRIPRVRGELSHRRRSQLLATIGVIAFLFDLVVQIRQNTLALRAVPVPSAVGRVLVDQRLEARVFAQRIPHWIKPKKPNGDVAWYVE